MSHTRREHSSECIVTIFLFRSSNSIKSGYFSVNVRKTLSPVVMPFDSSAIGIERQYMQVALEGVYMLNLTLTTKSDWLEELMKIERTFSFAFLLMIRTFRESNQDETSKGLQRSKLKQMPNYISPITCEPRWRTSRISLPSPSAPQ